MNIIFDLDGTLIDSRLRLYELFQYLAPFSSLTLKGYWSFKQKKISNEDILRDEFDCDERTVERFVSDWMEMIELPDFLAFDTSVPGVGEKLSVLRHQAALHVCTARQLRQPVLDQIARFGLLDLFDSIMITEQNFSKVDLISALPDLTPNDWMIGDTGHDIQTGKALGVKTCAVLSGFLSRGSLIPYGPDLILPSVASFEVPNQTCLDPIG